MFKLLTEEQEYLSLLKEKPLRENQKRIQELKEQAQPKKEIKSKEMNPEITNE